MKHPSRKKILELQLQRRVAQEPSQSPNQKLNIAIIGAGGRGGANTNGVKSETIYAYVILTWSVKFCKEDIRVQRQQ